MAFDAQWSPGPANSLLRDGISGAESRYPPPESLAQCCAVWFVGAHRNSQLVRSVLDMTGGFLLGRDMVGWAWALLSD